MSETPQPDDADREREAEHYARMTGAVIALANWFRQRGAPQPPIVDAIVHAGIAFLVATRGALPAAAELRRAAEDLEKRQADLADDRVAPAAQGERVH